MSQQAALRHLVDPLYRTAIELVELAQISDELQGLVARLIQANGQIAPELVAQGQAADLLSQRLEGVSTFLFALAGALPEGVVVDVSRAVVGLTLADQARRLSGQPAVALARGGAMQLFED